METWTAFLLGFVGSVHCAGMCGPLALALPHWGRGQGSFLAGRLLYNLGRLFTYGILGAIFGLVGQGATLVGLQRWVSLTLGALILMGLVISPRLAHQVPIARGVNWLKQRLGGLLQSRGLPALFGVGLLNGLLPCGLVYVAAAAAVATGDILSGVRYMLVFGLGTVPMLLIISLLGAKLRFSFRLRMQRLIPASLALVGVLLMLRGMALGIPYVSPKLPSEPTGSISCH